MRLQLSKLGLFNMKIYSMSYVNFQMISHTDTIPDFMETSSSDTSDNGSMQLLSQLFFFFKYNEHNNLQFCFMLGSTLF